MAVLDLLEHHGLVLGRPETDLRAVRPWLAGGRVANEVVVPDPTDTDITIDTDTDTDTATATDGRADASSGRADVPRRPLHPR